MSPRHKQKTSNFFVVFLVALIVGSTLRAHASQLPTISYTGGIVSWTDIDTSPPGLCGVSHWYPDQFFIINATGTMSASGGTGPAWPSPGTVVYSSSTIQQWPTNSSASLVDLDLSLPEGVSSSIQFSDSQWTDTCGNFPAVFVSNVAPVYSSPFVWLGWPPGATTTPDFTNWYVGTGNVSAGTLIVRYGWISSSSFENSDAITYSPFVNVNPIGVHKTHLLWYPPLSVPAHWWAYAELDMATSTATSSVIEFDIDPSAANPAAEPISNLMAPWFGTTGTSSVAYCGSTSSLPFFQLTGSVPYFTINFEYAMCSIFVMSPAQTQDLGNLLGYYGQRIATKPPLGYLTVAGSALSSLNAATSSTSTQLMDASGTAAFALVFGPLDQGAALIIYLMVLLWLYHRARNFQP